MAATFLPSPGTQFGPCEETCNHTDCALTREMAAKKCFYCDDNIGYEKRFYDFRETGLAHAVCAEEAETKRRAESQS